MRVLHVEDEPGMRDVMEEWVEARYPKITLDAAPNGEEGYNLCAERTYDCIITDYEMPFVDGIDFANKLSRDGFGGTVIFYTARCDRETTEAIYGTGAEKVFRKSRDSIEEVLDYVTEIAVRSCGD